MDADTEDNVSLDDDAEQSDATGRLIRPYLMTGGRTEVDEELRLETQLQTTPKGRREADDYRWEAKHILELADQPLALVEISAHAKIPIGVVRVIVSDLIRDEVLRAHRAIAVVSQQSHASLLEKVLNGVRSL